MIAPAPDPMSIPGSYPDNAALMLLIEGIVQQQPSALSRLYTCTATLLYRMAFAVLFSRQDAEEVVGDTFVYIWEHASQYDPNRGSVRGWLIVITRHRAIDLIRKRRQHVSLDDGDAEWWINSSKPHIKSPEELVSQWEAKIAIDGALTSLSPVRRQLIQLAFFEEQSHTKIAESLRLPEGTVKSHLRRGLLAMRTAMTSN